MPLLCLKGSSKRVEFRSKASCSTPNCLLDEDWMMKTLLLGLGNPILKDDSVGLKVVRELGDKVAEEDVHIEEASFANIDLLESIGSYDRLIIVDSIKTKEEDPGRTLSIEA